MLKRFLVVSMLVVILSVGALPAFGSPLYFQGFEDENWVANVDQGDWWDYVVTIERVVSGTNGITSNSGSAHAILNPGNPQSAQYGPYTRFGGYRDSFDGGFIANIDVYLDPVWEAGQGFDYSVAASRQDGSHLRDFIWHVGVVGDELLVNASNNSDWQYNSWKILNENGGNNFVIADAGWYTLENVFYDNAGNLAVDFNLRDENGNLLYSITRFTNDDINTVVGGNRYGWFTYNNVDGLAIDNVMLGTIADPIPEPATLTLLGLGMAGMAYRRLRKRA